MQKIAPSDGTELPLREESRCWDGAKPFLHGPTIMMGLVEEARSTPATAEQEGSERGALVPRAVRCQEHV